MAVAIYPGSFDPVTYGHLDIIKRTADVFDKVIIGVLINHAKNPLFSIEERVEMIKEVTRDIPNIEVVSFGRLLVDFCEKMGVNVIVRGIRAVSDFEYELIMAQTNKQISPNVETMFFATNSKYSFLSSSIVRELALFDGDISQFVPPEICERIHQKNKKINVDKNSIEIL